MKVQTTGRVLLHSLFRQRRLIVGMMLWMMGTIILGSLLWTPGYDASASLIIRGRNYQNLLFPEQRMSEWTLLMNPKEEINSEIEIIRGVPVLRAVVASLKLQEPRESKDQGVLGMIRQAVHAVPRLVGRAARALLQGRGETAEEAIERAVETLRGRLKVDPAIDSQIVRITYRDPDPVLASQVVNKIAEEYLRQHLSIHLNRGENTFYDEQVKAVETEMVALQKRYAEARSASGIISYPEQSKALVKKLETFEVALANAQKEIISKRSKVEKIQELRRSNPQILVPLPEFAQDVQIQDLENKLVNLRYQRESQLQRYTADNRQVVIAERQLRNVEAQIKAQVTELMNREAAELRKLQAEEEALSQTVQALKGEILRMSEVEPMLTAMERQINDKQEALSVLRKRFQDSLVARATDYRLENAKIVSPAAVPLRPAVPNFLLNVGLGFILALVISLSTAFFIEYWDDSLRVPEDVEAQLGRRVLGSIGEL